MAKKLALRTIKKVVTAAKQIEGGGFIVRRPIGGHDLNYCDPFLMLDHLGPVVYGPRQAVGAPDHPHRGFETVSYLIEGDLHHHDSVGNEGTLIAGDVQWMTAGRGVVHSEMPSEEFFEKGGRMEGFQLWVNLPAKEKMISPKYQDVVSAKIPEVIIKADKNGKRAADGKEQIKIRVIAGTCEDKKAVIATRTPIMYLDMIFSQVGAEFTQPVPEDYNGFAYVYRGAGLFGATDTKAEEGQAVQLGEGNALRIKCSKAPLRLLLIAGVPLNEPVARYGPFVMNTQKQIMEAFADYQSGKMGSIDGAEERYRKTKEAAKRGAANDKESPAS